MGIDGATKTKWVGKGLTLRTLHMLQLGKRVDVDGNALAWKYAQKGKKTFKKCLF